MKKVIVGLVGIFFSFSVAAQNISLFGFTLGQKIDVSGVRVCEGRFNDRAAWMPNLAVPCYFIDGTKGHHVNMTFCYPVKDRPEFIDAQLACVGVSLLDEKVDEFYFMSDDFNGIFSMMKSKLGNPNSSHAGTHEWRNTRFKVKIENFYEVERTYVKVQAQH